MDKKNKISRIIIFLSFSILFLAFLNNYLTRELWDYDFWWHLATGRYIVENKALPDEDPFSFVSNLEENKYINPVRANFILKQYWLSQVIFYKIYTYFDDKGIIILRSLILFTVVLLACLWLKRQNVKFYIIYPFVFFIFSATMVFVGERPVLFTILFTVIVFIILDDFKRRKGRIVLSLIPLMLVWANLHGGYILGIVIIFTYIFGETINLFLKRGEIDKKSLKILYMVGFASLAVSAINPNGFNVFLTLTGPKNKLFQAGIQEYASPLVAYQMRTRSLDTEYIILMSLFPLLMILRNKKIDIVYYLLLGGLLFMSVSAIRFIVYYVAISAMILGRELHYALEVYFKKFEKYRLKFEFVLILLIFVSSILFISGFFNVKRLTFGKAVTFSVPEKAADFIESNNLKGNIFNEMGFGGYLIWRFYPDRKVFIDTRFLNYTVGSEYSWISMAVDSLKHKELPEGKLPLWERLLDHYKIDVIVFNTLDYTGRIPDIIFRLVKHDKWIPVFHDLISVVFVRDNKENEDIINKYRLTEDDVFNAILVRTIQFAVHLRMNPRYMLSIGDIFYEQGRYSDALKAYEYAYKRHADNFIKFKIEQLKKEMESKS